MKEAAERVAKNLKESASQRIYGINRDQPAIAIGQSVEAMRDTSLEEVLAILNSSISIKLGFKPQWRGRQFHSSEYSSELQECLRDAPELTNNFVFYPPLKTKSKSERRIK